ncbi:50S ribosomal protein L27 [Candidatus Daviesbacteria bacterium RIFCSPLOWO2_01_FULL_38_10]|uniref:Large ribosomal subunit protein bL27 n=1 Tax=Candidatus Daviesbacteria bacterium GW2011_GWF2_38_6 TaxID=1618432 RepID=A0A0G0MTI0_9BACT|nr:MAG: 50S ribosomal protein L27 [Candidatus Daviesbacteria bacterium GW2011_GWA2_38_17]KKQ76994.1 MAG: 50S ribosomal protein L27 [Candidatus Daviesbacteria bacterium GW2011_GWF2_38_6]OGE26566.1 MAG: 50S ribosomal protein L27 [Candidatus Daviesbacteria bacterium RIFCSPHIGHO2_02_FULL_39_41]OGE27447.1 MAG: 50S ribosomal protein L27 [Candidatus Daviesbacteria bacterium RIFCSPHIGHO2_01_FULL_38_8b]OGE37159.1 MAG: 50S ribosomal protein L27 [Candidatus Daviesbacteria bacterium RIFCSPLOWO2_01_FULL_38_
MAHKTGGGSTRKNKDSISKRLGVKRFGGEKVIPGNILVRQKGNKFYPGVGTKQGNDYTIFAISTGKVAFKKSIDKRVVSVI